MVRVRVSNRPRRADRKLEKKYSRDRLRTGPQLIGHTIYIAAQR